jgi:hypothetical protein
MMKRGIQPPLANCGEAAFDVVIAGENRDYASVERLHAESPESRGRGDLSGVCPIVIAGRSR